MKGDSEMRDLGARKSTKINVQDQFLNQVRREKIRVVVELSDSQKLEGLVKSFDNYSIVLETERYHLIYKHAITNINVAKSAKVSFLSGEASVQQHPSQGR